MKLNPFQPAGLEPSYGRLDLEFRIATSSGWLFCSAEPFRLHADCFSDTQGTVRKSTATSEYLAGEYTVNAVKGMVTETVAVWVEGESHFAMLEARDVLIDAVTQVSYVAVKRVGPAEEVWSCQAADWTFQSPKELQHATKGILRVSVPRMPNVVRTEVSV